MTRGLLPLDIRPLRLFSPVLQIEELTSSHMFEVKKGSKKAIEEIFEFFD